LIFLKFQKKLKSTIGVYERFVRAFTTHYCRYSPGFPTVVSNMAFTDTRAASGIPSTVPIIMTQPPVRVTELKLADRIDVNVYETRVMYVLKSKASAFEVERAPPRTSRMAL
jgi:hypothetical protein